MSTNLGDRQGKKSRGWVHTHSATIVDLFRLVDASWIVIGLWLSCWYFDVPWSNNLSLIALSAIGIFTFLVAFWPIYRSWRLMPIRAELLRAGLLWLAAIAAVSLIANLNLYGEDIHRLLPAWAAITLSGLLLTKGIIRVGLRAIRIRGANFRTTAIVGANETAGNLAYYIRNISWMGLRFVGYYDDRIDDDRRIADLEVAGNLDELIDKARDGKIDIIYISLPLSAEDRIKKIVSALSDTTVTVYFVPNFAVLGLLSPHWDFVGGMPIISLVDTPHQGIDWGLKRIVDVLGASCMITILAIPMLVITLLIKLTSPGPVIFRQQRYGLEGKRIEIWKFRTMNVTEDGDKEFKQVSKNDCRITPIGRFLRRVSADELPQLFQVLKGDLSLVGPRPHPIALNEIHRKLISGYMLRHKVKPGITGWAQVNGYRGETDTEDKMRKRIDYDLDYINNWSIVLDLKILAMTFSKIFHDPNAY